MSRPANPDVRRRLLEAGLDIIHREGFSAAGVQALTTAAGVPKGSFYSYFDSKEHFAAAVLTEYWARIEAALGPPLCDGSVPTLRRLEAFFDGLSEDHARRDFILGCLIGNLTLEMSAGSNIVRSTAAELVARWQALLAECLASTELGGDGRIVSDPEETAELLVEAWEGAVMRGKLERSDRAYRRFRTRTLPSLVTAATAG